MIPDNLQSQANKIISAASDTINTIVNSICNNPGDPDHPRDPLPGFSYNQSWHDRYKAIEDLFVVSHKGYDRLTADSGFTERYPYLLFFVDEIAANPEESSSETFLGSLGAEIEVKGSNYASIQVELLEIIKAVSSILMLDQQLCHFHRGDPIVDALGNPVLDGSGAETFQKHGAIIERLKYNGFKISPATRDNRKNIYLRAEVFYLILFNEEMYQ